MADGFKFTGSDDILKNLKDSVKVVSETTQEGLIEIGERGVAILDRNTPVDEGRLRSSMSYTIANKVEAPLGGKGEDILRKSKDKDQVIIGTNVIYAAFVEYRAKNGSAGYMLRSYKQLVPIAKKVLETVLKKRFK